jgi:hypothetical protein
MIKLFPNTKSWGLMYQLTGLLLSTKLAIRIRNKKRNNKHPNAIKEQ